MLLPGQNVRPASWNCSSDQEIPGDNLPDHDANLHETCLLLPINNFWKHDCSLTLVYWLGCANYKPLQWESKEKEWHALALWPASFLFSNRPLWHSFRLQKLKFNCAQRKMLRVSCGLPADGNSKSNYMSISMNCTVNYTFMVRAWLMPKPAVSWEGSTDAHCRKLMCLFFALCCLHDDKVLRGNSCHHSVSLKHLLASNGLTWINLV